MITLTINGKRRTLEGQMTIADYLATNRIDVRIVAVEHNGNVLRREQFEHIVLREGDQVEIVRMIGGGKAP